MSNIGKGLRLFCIVALTMTAISPTFAQTCVDPPTTAGGKCSKQAGGRCDPASRKWLGVNPAAYKSCMGGSASKPNCGQRATVADCVKCSIDSGKNFSVSGINDWCAKRVGSRG